MTKTKLEPFEAGEVPISSPRQRFSIKFYMVALFFIVFDIEAVFLFPWAVLYKSWLADPAFAWVAFTEMFLFLGILSLGLVYVWKRGALQWD
jgi:NADH-quinone oxidoreductase subunit A